MSENIRKWTLTVSVAVLAVAALLGALDLVAPEAQAQSSPPSVVCFSFTGPVKKSFNAENIQAWMDGQISMGRARFVSVVQPVAPTLCAW